MISIGIRGKLFLAFLLLMLSIIFVSGLILEFMLLNWFQASIHQEQVLPIEQAMLRLRQIILIASLIAFLLAFLLSGFAAHFLTRSLKTIIQQAHHGTLGTSNKLFSKETEDNFNEISNKIGRNKLGGDEIGRLTKLLQRLEKLRQEFVANVSHELRTPISVILLNTETLLDGALEDPKAARSLLVAIERNTRRLSDILQRLMDLSRLDSGHYRLRCETTSIAQSILQAVETVQHASHQQTQKQKQIVVHSTVYQEKGSVLADSGALHQVLINLLENAIQYTPKEGRVVIRVLNERTQKRIEVEDDGPGIAPRERTRIFERFYRIDPGRSRETGGSGLGLAIVKHLVENMDGEIGVLSANPCGSIFWIKLPSA